MMRDDLILAAVTGFCANPADFSLDDIARMSINQADMVMARLGEELRLKWERADQEKEAAQ